MSLEPREMPAKPSVIQHMVPAPGVWSFSGCASVDSGSIRFHTPVVAVSLGCPTTHPVSDSMSSSSAMVIVCASALSGAEGPSGGKLMFAPLSEPAVK